MEFDLLPLRGSGVMVVIGAAYRSRALADQTQG